MSLENTPEHQEYVAENIRNQKILTGLSRTLETAKVKHVGERADAVHAVRAKLEASGITFRVSDRNWIVPERGGAALNLQAEVDAILLSDPAIGDPASVQAVVASGDLQVEARSDLNTPQQKSAFIAKHGYDAWVRLPAQRSGPVNTDKATMTCGDYMKLSIAQRIALQKSLTEPELGSILSRR